MYLNTTKKPSFKGVLRKCYRKLRAIIHAITGQVDFVPSGHFYSPIASSKEIEEGIAKRSYAPESLHGIDLRLDTQRELLQAFARLYPELPFTESKQPHLRYYFDNPAYCHSDGICLYSMMRFAKPKRIIEIGSGFSSALMHDVRDLFFSAHMSQTSNGGGQHEISELDSPLRPHTTPSHATQPLTAQSSTHSTHLAHDTPAQHPLHITHIEPYPALLHSLLRPSDLPTLDLLPHRLQEIDLALFSTLESSDILFIDSTHIAKINSDVNRIFFEILPLLQSGVYVHFHDIFYPFSYPNDWLREKNSWNEAYMLRAFLSFNDAFEIVFFNTCLNHLYPDEFASALPLSQKNTGGSIWLRKK